MSVDPVDPDLVRLLTSAIESVERFEILLAMRAEHPRSTTAKALARTLSIRATAVDTHLAFLCGRGFLGFTIGNDIVYAYKPISARIEQQVTDLVQLWKTRRRDVEAILGTASVTAASAFADAFRFRNDKKDGRDG
jgi:hypothetical protein